MNLFKEEFAKWWSGNHPFWNRVKNKGKYWEITYPKNSKIFYVNAKGADYNHVPNPFSKKGTSWTDRLAFNAYNHGYDITKIDNVLEGSGKVVNDVVIHSDVPRKSLLGNNGNFDFSDKNIYKMLIPTIIGGYSTLNN